MKNIVVCNTKGGAGKTTISIHILPLLIKEKYPKADITYMQLDNNNKNFLKTKEFALKEFKLNEANDAIDEAFLTSMTEENAFNIIDCGGGDDTKNILKAVANSGLEAEFIIPVNQNLNVRHNLEETTALIEKLFDNPKISLVLTMAKDLENYKEEFVNIFGNELWEIKPINLKHYSKIGVIPFYPALQVLEYKRTSLLDVYQNVKNLANLGSKARKDYALALKELVNKGEITEEESRKKFKEYSNKIRQAEEIVDFSEKIIKANENLV